MSSNDETLVRFALYSAQKLAAESRASWRTPLRPKPRPQALDKGPMTSEQHQQKRRELPRAQRPLAKGESTPDGPSRLKTIVTEVIEVPARTKADNPNNKPRRLVAFKDGCLYGKFGKTKAYELIAQQRIRAYKMGGKTLIDLDSVDEYHASLPRMESRAS